MDLCAANDRPGLKGALQACQRGKWNEAELRINGVQADGKDFPVAFTLEVIAHDGETGCASSGGATLPNTKQPR